MSDFYDLKPGDVVYVDSRGVYRPATVERVTATQIVLLGSPRRYRRSDGQMVGRGDPWDVSRLHHPTPEIESAAHRAAVAARVKRLVTSIASRGAPPPDHAESIAELLGEVARLWGASDATPW